MSRFCYNDIIYRFTKNAKIQLGVVWETAELLMCEEDVDEKKLKTLRDNHCINVCWYPRGRLQINPEENCRLLDRYLQQGDYVQKNSGPSQLGHCLDVRGVTALRILNTNKVIIDANFKDLKPLIKFRTLDIILFENWIGIIKEVEKEITVSTVDGSKFIMSEDVFLELDRVYETYDKKVFGQCFLYLGQILRGNIQTFDKSQWENVSSKIEWKLFKDDELITVKVIDIDVESIKVQWICGSYKKVDIESSYAHPKEILEKNDIKNIIKINDYKILDQYQGSHSHYVLKETDNILKLSLWKKNLAEELQKKENILAVPSKTIPETNTSGVEDNEASGSVCVESATKTTDNISDRKRKRTSTKCRFKRRLKRMKISEPFGNSFVPGEMVGTELMMCRSVVDVLWQDGTVETNIPSTQLYPPSHVDNNEYFPGEFVVENVENPKINEYGMIKWVNHDNRTLYIIWLQFTAEENERFNLKIVKEEETSVYGIKPHQDFRFKPGSFVLKIANLESSEEFPSVGKVLETTYPGMIKVRWLNGSITESYPQELYIVNTNEFIEELDTFSLDYDSWESISDPNEEEDDVESPKSFLPVEEDKHIDGEITDYATIQDIATNPLKEIPRLFESFCKNPTLTSSSQIFKLFELCNQCKKFENLILKVIKFYTGQGESLRNSAYEIARFDDVKVAAITTTFMTSLRLIKELDTYVNENINTIFRGELPQEKSKELMKEEQKIILKDIKLLNEFSSIIIEERSPYISQHEDTEHFGSYDSCHKICQILEHKLNESSTSSRESLILLNKISSKIIPESKLENEEKRESAEEHETLNSTSNGILTFLDNAPQSHHFIKEKIFTASYFSKALNKEYKLLMNALPAGILVKAFQDRTDLLSVLIKGPKQTPYEDGLFYFDLHLPPEYPRSPPRCFYASFCSERLNPNLYEEGKVCLSLLGTWVGEGTETWVSCKSTLLQVLISIQSLILVAEPYFNEAGFEKQIGTKEGELNSRLYNEMAVIKVLDSMAKMLENPPQIFQTEILNHFQACGSSFCLRLESFIKISEAEISENTQLTYPLLPASKGFCISLGNSLKKFRDNLSKINA